MTFDPDNIVIQLCAQGMAKEGMLEQEEAKKCFEEAWLRAQTDFEKFIACHYIARHQRSPEEKLQWDELALSFAIACNDKNIHENYSSLYLNIANDFEELRDYEKALRNYMLAGSYADLLKVDGYGAMIRSGINRGIEKLRTMIDNPNQ
jgi:tetratricopeptide (TPR) repeat protein